METKPDSTWMIAAGLVAVLVLMSGVFFVVGSIISARPERAKQWPSTEGVIVTNKVVTVDHRDAKTGYWYERASRVFEYSFVVDGKTYTNTLLAYGEVEKFDIDAEMPVGAKVPVYYDPEDPADAVLITDVEVSRTPFHWVSFGMLALALPFAYLAVRMARSKG